MLLSKRTFLIVSGVFATLLFGFFSQRFASNQFSSQSIAASVKSSKQNPVSKCYNSFYDEPKEIWSVQQGQYVYYQILAHPKKTSVENTIAMLYFRVSNYRCEFLNPGGSLEGRLSLMPKSVAVKFAEQWYKPAFDKCIKSKTDKKRANQLCIKVFEDDINVPPNTKEVSPQFIFTEDAIALNKLGIRTDKALVVDTYPDFRKYMSKFGWPSVEPNEPRK